MKFNHLMSNETVANLIIKALTEAKEIAMDQLGYDSKMEGPVASGMYGAAKDNNLDGPLKTLFNHHLQSANTKFKTLRELDDSLDKYQIAETFDRAIEIAKRKTIIDV